jgi:hypothetical protein
MHTHKRRPYHLQTAKLPTGNMNGWQERHLAAVKAPAGPEIGLVSLIDGWTEYANYHAARYETPIGNDTVLGPEWAAIGMAIRGLLNGESGRLDCGVLDGFILDTLATEGY